MKLRLLTLLLFLSHSAQALTPSIALPEEKALIVSKAEEPFFSMKHTGIPLMKTVAHDVAVELGGVISEQTLANLFKITSFPPLDQNAYNSLFKETLTSFLKEFLPRYTNKPHDFIARLPLHENCSEEYFNTIVEKTCHEFSIDPRQLTHELYYYKKLHNYDQKIKQIIDRKKIVAFMLGGAGTRVALEYIIHNSPTLSSWLVTRYNKDMYHSILDILIKALLPLEVNSRGTLLWKYCTNASEKTLKYLQAAGITSLIALHSKKFYESYNSNNTTLEVALSGILLLSVIVEKITPLFDSLTQKKDVTFFEQASFKEALHSW